MAIDEWRLASPLVRPSHARTMLDAVVWRGLCLVEPLAWFQANVQHTSQDAGSSEMRRGRGTADGG
jgi:hypothetical protein